MDIFWNRGLLFIGGSRDAPKSVEGRMMRIFNTTTGLILTGALTVAIWVLAFQGAMSPIFEDDLSIREESAGNGRVHGGGGLHGGK